MPLLTGTLTADGAVVDLLVGVSYNRRRRLLDAGFALPAPVALRAQIDPGSYVTGLIPSVFVQLGITRIATIAIRTPSTTPDNPHRCEQFDVSLALVSGADVHELLTSALVIASADFQREEDVQAILGRDVLDRCVFTYAGPHRTFSLAF